MKIKYIFILIFAVSATAISAKIKTKPSNNTIQTTAQTIVGSYIDSLAIYQNNASSQQAPVDSLNAAYSRLFIPLAFYHSSIGKQISINSNDSNEIDNAVDHALLALYLNRPDLVRLTETQLNEAGTIRTDDEEVIKSTKVKLADKVAPKPEVPKPETQSGIIITKPNFWKFSADTKYQLQQYYYSGNWHKGGESNYTMYGEVKLKANYNNKQKVKFDNELVMQLGFRNTREDTLHKFKTNTDVIRYTGKLGLQASKKWYYSFELIAYTQFTQGHKSNDSYVYSDFMSPFNLNLSVGMDYSVATKNNRLKGSINLSPLAFNFKYVDRKNLATRFGIKNGHRTAEDFGSKINAKLDWQITDLVKWTTRLYGFTSYKRALVEWENNFSLRISKYISAELNIYPRFDDSAKRDEDTGYLQFYEYSSIGFNYSF